MPYRTRRKIKTFKNIIFWSSLLSMFGFCAYLFFLDFNIPQREISYTVNLKDKINICLPADDVSFNENQEL